MFRYIIGIFSLIVLGLLGFYKFYFLRNPSRNIPKITSSFISPANGVISKIIKTSDKEYVSIYKNNKKALDAFVSDLGNNVTIVSIMMDVFNVHRQRAPYDAKLIKQVHTDGLYLNAVKDASNMKATLRNENNIMTFETKDGKKFKVIQIAGLLARRIVPLLKIGQSVNKGDTIGLIKLGSQVTVIFNSDDFELNVKQGDTVIDGETILAEAK